MGSRTKHEGKVKAHYCIYIGRILATLFMPLQLVYLFYPKVCSAVDEAFATI